MKFILFMAAIYTVYCLSFFWSEILYWAYINLPDCVLELALKLHLLDWMA